MPIRLKPYLSRVLLIFGLTMFACELLAAEITDIRVWNSPEKTRIVFDLSSEVKYKVFEVNNPDRVVIDISKSKYSGKLPSTKKLGDRIIRMRTGQHKDHVRFTLDMKLKVRWKDFTLRPNDVYGDRLVVDVFPVSAKQPVVKRRKDDKFIVVIDAGHGGEDPGAVGARKTLEKDLVLKIAKQLSKELNQVQGIRAELTRKGDYYVPLRKRTRIATDLNADLFVSIHADAFTKRSAHGISVFALSQRGATSERARLLANKENAADLIAGESLTHKDEDVAETLADLSFTGKSNRSLDLGAMVRMRLSRVGRLHGHGVEQAGFVVLKVPAIPAILVEVGFISNPGEERKLRTKAYQSKIVKEIKTGIVQYVKKYPGGQDKWRTANSQ